MILYFSGCGNSRFVAESIAKALDERLLFVPEEERNGKCDYELGDGEISEGLFDDYIALQKEHPALFDKYRKQLSKEWNQTFDEWKKEMNGE